MHGLVDRGKLLRRSDDRLHVELPIATGETGTGQCGDDLAQLGQRGLREVIDGTDGGARRLHVTADHGHLLRQRPQTAADILLGGGRLRQQQHDEQRVANAMGCPGDRACV